MAKRSSVIGYWLLFTGYWLFSATAMAQGVTDVHSHIITTEFLSALEGEGRLMDEGFPLPKYDAAAHLRWMDEAGVETSVLTLAAPQPETQETHPRPLPVREGSGYLVVCFILH